MNDQVRGFPVSLAGVP